MKKKANTFTMLNRIPLGMNSYKGVSKDKIICMPYLKYSGALGVIGESGTGKTVMEKRIYSYLLGYYQQKYKTKRPGIIFDMQSEDHHLSKFPNSIRYNLFFEQGEYPFGLENLRTYAPVFIAEEAHNFDTLFGFSVDNFTMKDFLSIGMGPGAAKELHYLIRTYPESTKNIDKFYEALSKIPTNSYEVKNLPEDYPFKMTNYMIQSSKMSMINSFTHAYNDNVFIDDRDGRLNNKIIDGMMDGTVLVINFHQEARYYSLYAGKILRDLYYARRESKRREMEGRKGTFPPPIIIIEEVDKLVPKDAKDSYQASHYWLLEILKRGRKYDFMTIIATQEASAMGEEIKAHTRQWIIGKMVSNDYAYFSTIFSPQAIDVIRMLDKSKHEFCIIYEDNTFDTFYAWNSPLEINRESTMEKMRA